MDGVTLAETIVPSLRADGFAVVTTPLSELGFVDLARALGEIVDDTIVELVPGARAYLMRPEAMPLHTDHATADIVAWRCESQDREGGATILLDGYRIIGMLSESDRARLEEIFLPATLYPEDVPVATPVLSHENGRPRLFYVPWMRPLAHSGECAASLRAFREKVVQETKRAVAVRIEPGQVLVVDNHRMMHGRDALSRHSGRRLRRLWIKAHRWATSRNRAASTAGAAER